MDLHNLIAALLILVLFNGVQPFCGTIFDRLTVAELNSCMEMFIPTAETIPKAIWEDRLPTEQQRAQMYELIRKIYMSTNYLLHCDRSVVMNYQYLLDVVQLTLFQDRYCIIHEPIPTDGKYFRHFWGYVIIANPLMTLHHLHHSVSHVQTDGEVAKQAAYLFEATNSRTLVIAGATRNAVIGNITSECQSQYLLADSAHDNRTMFHLFNVAIHDAAKSLSNSSVFIQWHGMANTSCNDVQAFISAGGDQSSSIYADPNSPVNRIYRNYNRYKGNAETPATSTCRLTARTNIFGRYINGVPLQDVCNTYSKDKDIRGEFVHIEQKKAAIDDWGTWTIVLTEAFDTSSVDRSARFSVYTFMPLFFVLYRKYQ